MIGNQIDEAQQIIQECANCPKRQEDDLSDIKMTRTKFQTLLSTFSFANLQEFKTFFDSKVKLLRLAQMDKTTSQLVSLSHSHLALHVTYLLFVTVSKNEFINQLEHNLEICTSKQHSRLVIIYGKNLTHRLSLLKGREDLRQDQRVMQFFELISQHILHDFSSESKGVKNHQISNNNNHQKLRINSFL
jgi:phosphatidylinositol kinase/protein kinase (PI-3  family)